MRKLLTVNDSKSSEKLPVILHHGILGFPEQQIGPLRLRYYRGIDAAIERRGNRVLITRVHPTASVACRAGELRDFVLRKLDSLGASKAILIAHSMGGLDARYAITHLGLSDRIAALLTVSAPHRGSSVADWWKLHIGSRLGGFRLARSLGLNIEAVHDLTLDACCDFNRATPDVAGVRYYSVGSARPWHRIPAFAIPSWRIIHKAEGDNDGLVSARSAEWGKSLGVWPADHWHTINHRMVWEIKQPTGNITPYYLAALEQIEADLASDSEMPELTSAASSDC